MEGWQVPVPTDKCRNSLGAELVVMHANEAIMDVSFSAAVAQNYSSNLLSSKSSLQQLMALCFALLSL
jgi:hypothetical protein